MREAGAGLLGDGCWGRRWMLGMDAGHRDGCWGWGWMLGMGLDVGRHRDGFWARGWMLSLGMDAGQVQCGRCCSAGRGSKDGNGAAGGASPFRILHPSGFAPPFTLLLQNPQFPPGGGVSLASTCKVRDERNAVNIPGHKHSESETQHAQKEWCNSLLHGAFYCVS